MYGVASLLNPTATRQTQEIWEWLEENCGLAGIRLTPLPHFSWQVTSEYNLEKAEEILRNLAKVTVPFTVRAAGIGIFCGPQPVIYIQMVKNRTMLELHEKIWNNLLSCMGNPNSHYDIANWIPHITLANRDVTKQNLPCALEELAFRPISLDIRVDHFAMIYELSGEIGIKFRYDFSGS